MKPDGSRISSELISAMSALNTETTYDGGPRDEDGEWVFIADAEPLAAHSIEHMKSAFDIASKDIRAHISELRVFLHKLPCIKDDFENWEKMDGLIRKIENRL